MITRLIGGFVAILIGVNLVGPVAELVMDTATDKNDSGGVCTYAIDNADTNCQLYMSSSWSATILKMVPGFFALGILGIGVAVTYGSLRDAGVV